MPGSAMLKPQGIRACIYLKIFTENKQNSKPNFSPPKEAVYHPSAQKTTATLQQTAPEDTAVGRRPVQMKE